MRSEAGVQTSAWAHPPTNPPSTSSCTHTQSIHTYQFPSSLWLAYWTVTRSQYWGPKVAWISVAIKKESFCNPATFKFREKQPLGATTDWYRQNIMTCDSGPFAPFCETTTSSTEPEVINILHCRQRPSRGHS